MRKKLIVSLLLFTTLSFSYDFEGLEVSYSEKNFNEKGCGAIITLLEKMMTKKMKDADEYDEEDVALFLTNIASDVADGDKRAVDASLTDAEFDKEEIALILKQLPEAPLPIDPDLIANWGKIDVDKVVKDYLETGVIEPEYKKFKSSIEELGVLYKESEKLDKKLEKQKKESERLDKESERLDKKNERLDKELKEQKELQKMIEGITKIFSGISPAK